jgi:adenylate cyclase
MGDTVNLAARLESACKQYGTNILMAENTIECVRDEVVVREVDVVRVVGKSRPVRVFELVGEKGDVSREKTEELGIFHEALGHYRKREWDRALDLFKTLSDDPLAALYIGRSLKLKQNPPSEDWDHVAELVSK